MLRIVVPTLLALAALAPAASADTSCTVAAWTGNVGFSCQTDGAAVAAVVTECVDGVNCPDPLPVSCTVDLTPRAVCWI